MEKIKEANILKPYGSLDVLYYYSKTARVCEKFLKNREIATKTLLPRGMPFFIKRGSNSKPLYAEDLGQVDEKMLKLREKHHLKEVRDKLVGKQELIWTYFVPRKLIHFFYACNGERQGKKIDRVFIDIDRKENSQDDARKVALSLVEIIKNDKEFSKLVKFKILVLWTGSSFHVYLLLERKVDLKFYQKYLSYGEKKEESFIMKWAELVTRYTGINVKVGHEKEKDRIILDSSNTPSGKLGRVPFSLHMKDANNIDGICVPVSEKELEDKNLISKLRKLTSELVLKNITKYEKLLN